MNLASNRTLPPIRQGEEMEVWGGEQTSPPSGQLETGVSEIGGSLPEALLQSPSHVSLKRNRPGTWSQGLRCEQRWCHGSDCIPVTFRCWVLTPSTTV